MLEFLSARAKKSISGIPCVNRIVTGARGGSPVEYEPPNTTRDPPRTTRMTKVSSSAKYRADGQSHRVKSQQEKQQDRRARIRGWVHLTRRLLVLAAALWYMYLSVAAATRSMSVLRGVVDHSMTFSPYVFQLIAHYVGKSTIRGSSLVVEVLSNSTEPRNDSLYLQTENRVSYTNCGPQVKTFNPWTYGNAYMRENLADLTLQTSYNLTHLADGELIMPVVDCTSDAIVFGDMSVTRVFYLMRSKTDHDDVYVLTWSLSTQDYQLPDEHQLGGAASSTLTFINDVRDKSVKYYHVMRLGFPFQMNAYEPYTLLGLDAEGFWQLESIPRDATKEATKVIRTASRTGFYVNSESEQCNVKNQNWDHESDPVKAMAKLSWSGYTTIRDSWAWVHGIHFFFALDALFNLVILVVVVYQNARKRKRWVGDAFVSVSSTIALRAALVLLTWYVNGFWTLMEYCLQESNELSNQQHIFTFPQIIHADLLTFYLGLAGLLGHLLRERIDPALAVVLFELGFQNRRGLGKWFPKTMETAVAFANADFLQALAFMQPKHAVLTPMRMWSVHSLKDKDAAFIFATLFPVFATFALLVAYVPIRKVYRYFYPDRRITMSKFTGASTGAEALLAWKSSLTIFEVATGAPLQNRVGLVTDYDNCIYIKGLKFASADGIYCNGYVISQGKWLISTEDLLAIGIMIITRVRFKNVYVYEVNNFTVQQTARLVYPETMTLRDLVQLNVSILS